MAQVSEKVLAWLYNVLREYVEPQRAYTDAAQSLQAFPSLAPRTEIHTSENGSSAVLLTLSGTLPTNFRGTLYHFPIKMWLPRSYPMEPPFIYVTPSSEIQVRPGQHVSLDGRVYHPYIRDWSGMWDRKNVVELLRYLQQAFAKEPPVMSRQARTLQANGAAPQLPPKQGPGYAGRAEMPETNTPPPRPPKADRDTPQRDLARDGPPLPPLPDQRRSGKQVDDAGPITQHSSGYSPMPPRDYRSGQVLSLVPAQQDARRLSSQTQPAFERSPVSPISQSHGPGELPYARRSSYVQPAAPFRQHNILSPAPNTNQQWSQAWPAPVTTIGQTPSQLQQKRPTQDLLSDPFDVALPTAASTQRPAPPIPPNPEREHLLQALTATLVAQAQQKIYQNVSALAPLQTQQNALRAAYSRLEGELAQLEALDAALASNEAILRSSIQECDRTISAAKTKKQPPIDDVLVPTTLVAQQLWSTSAEEAACREAMYALQRAVDRGRINGSDFVRQMRGLGRECFLKMALARKCARGLGLDDR